MQKYAPMVLRFGLTFVFLWFGLSQITNPQAWTALIPGWIVAMGFSALTFVYVNGAAEVILALLLAFNIWTRPVAFLLFLHLASIVVDVGFNAIGVRDIGLSISCLALSLWGGHLETENIERDNVAIQK